MAWSENNTHVNNGFTVPELAEIRNHSNFQGGFVFYLIMVSCRNNTGLPQQFTLHVGQNPDEGELIAQHPNQASTVATHPEIPNNFTIENALQTHVDNHWYRVVFPSTWGLNHIRLTLDSLSVSHGYNVELYTSPGSNTFVRVAAGNDGRFSITPGATHYIRVHNTSIQNTPLPLSGANYILTITPELTVNHVEFWTFLFTGFDRNFPGPGPVPRRSTNGHSYINTAGFAVRQIGNRWFGVEGVEVTIIVTNFSHPTTSILRTRDVDRGLTNSTGRFDIPAFVFSVGLNTHVYIGFEYGHANVRARVGNIGGTLIGTLPYEFLVMAFRN